MSRSSRFGIWGRTALSVSASAHIVVACSGIQWIVDRVALAPSSMLEQAGSYDNRVFLSNHPTFEVERDARLSEIYRLTSYSFTGRSILPRMHRERALEKAYCTIARGELSKRSTILLSNYFFAVSNLASDVVDRVHHAATRPTVSLFK
ncbi:hypothetical protein BS47DRAFT_1487738 [Hydnum rufescens UP504]|uniref:Uncharacterized protein n=1 Tax=Hydnum rufescens UP504 TaxID=1448309 RepID=A0A9P6DTS3_9AGAM|nr:hypothetical protein BS47DRAFT_1487738 [Hydnum rufescens UP504]